MSAIEQDLATYLLAQPAISALIVARMYPARLPQSGALPAVTYQRIAGVPEFSHDGPADLARARFQLDCWANTYSAMSGVATAITDALNGYAGPMGTNAVTAARVVNSTDRPESEPKLWRRIVEVEIWHAED